MAGLNQVRVAVLTGEALEPQRGQHFVTNVHRELGGQPVGRHLDSVEALVGEEALRKAAGAGGAERVSDAHGVIPGQPGAYHWHGLRGQLSARARIEACRRASRKALDFLVDSQLPSGEFRTWLSTDFDLLGGLTPDSSPFVTTFVLHSLRWQRTPALDGTAERALAFLLREQDGEGFWKYWRQDSAKSSLDALDVDGASCASWVLASYGRPFLDNRAAVAANRDRDGRFMTWIGPAEEENDVDGVVNANVVLYLGGCEETAAACDYLCRLVESPESVLGSWYYPDPLALDHAVSRAAWHGVDALRGCRDGLLTRVSERCASVRRHQHALGAALAALTLLNCEAEIELLDRQIELILDSQCDDGSWPRVAFYSGPRPPQPRSVWFGSEELTTALCLETLARFASLD